MFAELQQQYAKLSDDELLHLASDQASLTDEANAALDAEMRGRNITAVDTQAHATGFADSLARLKFISAQVEGIFAYLGFTILGAIGVPVLAAMSVFTIVPLLRMLHPSMDPHFGNKMLTEIHWFPIQWMVGTGLGASVWLRLRSESLKWVWVLPSICFVAAVCFMPLSESVLLQEGRLEHFLGNSCDIRRRCFDQLSITLPFYSSVAFSIGSMVAFALRRGTPQSTS